MKVLFCFALAVACASAASSSPLSQDFDQIKALIPTASIALIAGEHLLFDSQFRKAKDFLQSDEFKTYCSQAIESPEFYAILEYLGNAGVNTASTMDTITEKLKLPAYTGPIPAVSQRTVQSFLTSVFNALPKSKIQSLINSLLSTSPEFEVFYDQVTAPAFDTLVQNFLNAPSLAAVWQAIEANGINPQEIITLVKGVFVV